MFKHEELDIAIFLPPDTSFFPLEFLRYFFPDFYF